MSSSGPLTIQDIRVVTLVFPIIACLVTVFRLTIRTRAGIWWWDDAFALLSMLFIIVLMGVNWTHTADPTTLSTATKIGVYYTVAQVFYGVVWAARLSILFTVIRIAPTPRERNQLKWIAALFCIIWAVLFAQVFWVCEREPGWKHSIATQCSLGQQVAISQLVTDTFADLVLIVAPLRLLWDIQLRPALRVRLMAIFSTSIITTIVSLVHAVIVLRIGGLEEAMAAIFEDSFSLIVCNLAVVATAIERLLPKNKSTSEFSPGFKASTVRFAREENTNTVTTTHIDYSSSKTDPSLWGGRGSGKASAGGAHFHAELETDTWVVKDIPGSKAPEVHELSTLDLQTETSAV